MAHSTYRVRSRHAVYVTATPRALAISSNELSLPEYTAVLSHDELGVTTFKVTAPSARVALAEITRRSNRVGRGWKVAVYAGLALVATREPGDRGWRHLTPQTKAPFAAAVAAAVAASAVEVAPSMESMEAAPSMEAAREALRMQSLEALQADLRRLRDRLMNLRDARSSLEEEHANFANLRDERLDMARESASLA